MHSIYGEITAKTGLPVLENKVTGAQTTTMAVGGAFRSYIDLHTPEEVSAVVKILRAGNQRYRILGNGSNIIISDAGVEDWVLHLGKGFRQYVSAGAGRFKVSGSMPLMLLSRELSESGFSGLEFAGGIPASFGGAVRMNAGAHGGSVGDIVEEVSCITPDGQLVVLQKNEMRWGYRKSIFTEGLFVLSATVSLVPGDKEHIAKRRADYLHERRLRQPLYAPSAGSIFKNPPNDFAGAVLERVGMKGVSLGKATVSTLHANWILNPTKEATAAEVEGLIAVCHQKAASDAGIQLEREVIGW